MEEKVLFHVLNTINKNKSAGQSAPDPEYIRCLAAIGMVDDGWDTTLTSLGRTILEALRPKFEKW